MKFIAIKLIRLYQIFLSPFIGQNCRYHPTCSNYTMIAIERFGFWNGSILALKEFVDVDLEEDMVMILFQKNYDSSS